MFAHKYKQFYIASVIIVVYITDILRKKIRDLFAKTVFEISSKPSPKKTISRTINKLEKDWYFMIIYHQITLLSILAH